MQWPLKFMCVCVCINMYRLRLRNLKPLRRLVRTPRRSSTAAEPIAIWLLSAHAARARLPPPLLNKVMQCSFRCMGLILLCAFFFFDFLTLFFWWGSVLIHMKHYCDVNSWRIQCRTEVHVICTSKSCAVVLSCGDSCDAVSSSSASSGRSFLWVCNIYQ